VQATTVLALLAATAIHGVVLRGPTKPVCSMTEPCSEPARGATLAFVRGSHVVARVHVDARGRYRASLAPGRYVVRVVPASRIGGIRPATVRVVRGADTRRDFLIDTGIR
jgi:hypothetical protein